MGLMFFGFKDCFLQELTLCFISFLTSAIAGIVGLGGGLILIGILPSFLPLNAIIPIHGFSQVSSNLSRAYFGKQDIKYSILPSFLLGSFVGVGVFALILNFISLEYLPLFIGVYILLSLWSQKFNDSIKKYENYFIIGFFQTGLSVIVGTTGPLAITKLLKDFQNRNIAVSTSALLMSISHILKVAIFFWFGFVFFEYIWTIVSMIIGAILGSYVGTKYGNKLNGKYLLIALKVLLTLLAIKALMSVIH
jgi:uncharacterized membrane protein YfcA